MIQISKYLIPALGALAVAAGPVAGATAPTLTTAPLVTQDDDAEEELEWLQDEYSNAFSAWLGRLNAAKNDEAREALMVSHPANELAPLFLVFARKHPRTDYAWVALSWVAAQLREGEHLVDAVELLARDHVADQRLADICISLRNAPEEGVSRGLRTIAEKSPHRDVQGTASFSLGVQLRARAAQAGEEAAATLLAEFEELMELVQENFADVEMFGQPLDSWASGALFEHRNLQIGMPAPNIEGEDIDGVSFQLSDYRGKVVMLDFWGHW